VGQLSGHTGIVLSVEKSDNIYISGGSDRKLFLWDSKTYKVIDMLYGFTSMIKQILKYKDNKIFISRYKIIDRFWGWISDDFRLPK